MKAFGKTVVFCLVMMLMCSFVYPLALTGVSQLTMKAKADGSKVDKDGNLTTCLLYTSNRDGRWKGKTVKG